MTFKDIGFRGIYHRFWAMDINDTIKKSSSEFPDFEKANCVLLYGYIDHEAGTTMEIIACGHKDNDGFSFYNAPVDRRSFIRIGAIEDEMFYNLDNIFDELQIRYQKKIEGLNLYTADSKLMETKTFFGRLLNEPYKDSGCHEGDIIEFHIYETNEGKFVCVSEGKTLNPLHTEENILKAAIQKFNQSSTEDNLIDILEILRGIPVWIPCNAIVSEADIDSLKSKKAGDTFQSTDDIRMVPDILQSGDKFFFPVFTSCDEMGDYGENFSKIEKWFIETIPIAQNNEKQITGIVINAFTDAFVLPNKLIEIIRQRGSKIIESDD